MEKGANRKVRSTTAARNSQRRKRIVSHQDSSFFSFFCFTGLAGGVGVAPSAGVAVVASAGAAAAPAGTVSGATGGRDSGPEEEGGLVSSMALLSLGHSGR